MILNYRGALDAYKPWHRRIDYKWIGLMAYNAAITAGIVYVAYHFIAKYW